ncbi:MAG: hypothetical protein U0168_20585 [Nannocystaceae bacterium]
MSQPDWLSGSMLPVVLTPTSSTEAESASPCPPSLPVTAVVSAPAVGSASG